ncbi:uracil-DNA glycosylase [Erysipelothrix larvae]|uniref:Uracil-DNA glycosylase n=1 Tax=Erysipelothrix larvae TaxID=1514105 RepID=A0A109UGH7_9FIRM|nr:uracil-DNA glycosylase [Erysipelothrix larvae]AMC92713.1 uracil-DNA glycosylase [Erysipelothrix larvae]
MIDATWERALEEVLHSQAFKDLMNFVDEAYATKTIYPPKEQLFNAFNVTPFDACKVVILGQDPYHGPNQAMGLSFSVNEGVPLPKSLANIYRELYDDLKITRLSGDLTSWAQQGVLLLNTLLSVEHGKPLSHQNKGWEVLSDAVIHTLNKREEPVIFVLWGKEAQSKAKYIDDHHILISGPHPSPLSAYRGFFGSKPFSRINQELKKMNKTPIDWS